MSGTVPRPTPPAKPSRKRALSGAADDDEKEEGTVGASDEVETPCKQRRRTSLTVEVFDPAAPAALLGGITIYIVDTTGAHVFQPANGERVEVRPGTYDIRAFRAWHVPVPAVSAGVVVAEAANHVERMQLQPLAFHLHVDADRDGAVDADRTGLANWRYGTAAAGRKGAIMLCNNDDDDALDHIDHDDQVVNQNNDHTEIAPIEIRRDGPAIDPSAWWTAQLAILNGHEAYVRIFDGRAAGSAQVAGVGGNHTYALPNLNFPATTLGIEAASYATGVAFAGLVTLRFTMSAQTPNATLTGFGPPAITYSEDVQFRVAPWMIQHHLVTADEIFAADLGLGPASLQTQFLLHLDAAATASGATFTTVPGIGIGNDIWLQDTMELGQHSSPHASFRVVNQSARRRGLEPYPRTLLAQDRGYVRPSTAPPTTYDSMGNLEVTPPFTSPTGVHYPFGRIYYCHGDAGQTIDPTFEAFLAAQVVQAPLAIDASFMLVGHVDEIITFVPAPHPHSSQGFKLLIASPRRAWALLHGMPGTATLLTNQAGQITKANFVLRDVNDPTNAANPQVRLMRYNLGIIHGFDDVQTNLDRVLSQLVTELDLAIPATHRLIAPLQAVGFAGAARAHARAQANGGVCDVIEVPVIFEPNAGAPTKADGFTVDMVNMVVANGHCMVPWPFGPYDATTNVDAFAADLEASLTAIGLTVHWINSWYYHTACGGVHCGSNTLRQLQAWRWWEYPNA